MDQQGRFPVGIRAEIDQFERLNPADEITDSGCCSPLKIDLRAGQRAAHRQCQRNAADGELRLQLKFLFAPELKPAGKSNPVDPVAEETALPHDHLAVIGGEIQIPGGELNRPQCLLQGGRAEDPARQSRQLIRLGSVRELDGTSGGALCKAKKLSKLRLPQDMAQADRRKLRYSDTDLNGHVNNTRYADFACDALEMEKLGPRRFLSEMQIGYLAECRPGEELRLLTGREGDVCFAQGMDESGKSRFEASLIFGEVLP